MGVVESMNTVTLAGGNKVELNEFQWSMLELDCALTGHSPAEAWNPSRNQPSTPEAFIEKGDIWYLSDGGYLRLVFRFETGALFLASESTDKVRQAWNTCSQQIQKVRSILCAAAERLLD